MPRNYQLKKHNPYHMDKDIYMQMFYLIRSFPNLIERRETVLYGSAQPSDGMPKGNKTSDPTQDKAIKLSTIDEQIKAIEQVIMYLNGKYSPTYTGGEFMAYEAFADYGVFCYFRSKPCKDEAPTTKTWYRYRSEFAYYLAKELNYF